MIRDAKENFGYQEEKDFERMYGFIIINIIIFM